MMTIISIDVLDGKGLVEIVVKSLSDQERLRGFVEDASEALEELTLLMERKTVRGDDV